MPIYEFECTACKERFERLQKLSDPDPSACPECGHAGVRRCLTAPAFRLSGSGWYETDFKKDGDSKRNLASKDEAPAADSGKVEAKPDAAAASKSDSGTALSASAPVKPKADQPDGAKSPSTKQETGNAHVAATRKTQTGEATQNPAKTSHPNRA